MEEVAYMAIFDPQAGLKEMSASELSRNYSWVGNENKESKVVIKKSLISLLVKRTQFPIISSIDIGCS